LLLIMSSPSSCVSSALQWKQLQVAFALYDVTHAK